MIEGKRLWIGIQVISLSIFTGGWFGIRQGIIMFVFCGFLINLFGFYLDD